MTVDPNNLLIFKMRQKQQEQVVTTGKPLPGTEETPKEPLQNAPAQKPTEQVAKTEEPAPAVPPQFRFKPGTPSAPAPQQQILQQPQTKQEETDRLYPHPRNYYDRGTELAEYKEIYGKYMNVKGKAQSRSVAKNLFCAWHPWRHSYAICAFCHRPFCFEDITEYKKEYYCIEDIDRVEEKYMVKLTSEYGTTSLITAGMVILVFVLFLYFTRNELLYLASLAQQQGVQSFIFQLNLGYALPIAGVIIMLASLIVSLYSLLAAKRGHIVSIVMGFVAVSYFSYMYVSTAALYFALITALEFVVFLTIIYTSATAIKVFQSPMLLEGDSPYDILYLSNLSKF